MKEMKTKIDITKFSAQMKSLTALTAIKLAPAKGNETKVLRKAILKQIEGTVDAEIYRDTIAVLIKDLNHAVNADEIKTAKVKTYTATID